MPADDVAKLKTEAESLKEEVAALKAELNGDVEDLKEWVKDSGLSKA